MLRQIIDIIRIFVLSLFPCLSACKRIPYILNPLLENYTKNGYIIAPTVENVREDKTQKPPRKEVIDCCKFHDFSGAVRCIGCYKRVCKMCWHDDYMACYDCINEQMDDIFLSRSILF